MKSLEVKEMEVFQAIQSRRSISNFKEEIPPREYIEKMLEAATWAPNHYKTEPWQFFVISGEARKRFGTFLREVASKDPDRFNLDKIEKGPLRAPVIIAVAVEPPKKEKEKEIEQIAAVSCAIQNMMLVAPEYGLATVWKTGEIIYQKEVNQFFDLDERYTLLGFIYVGYPKEQKKLEGKRIHFSQKTTWIDQ